MWSMDYKKPNWAPPVIDGSVRTVAHGQRCYKWKNRSFRNDVLNEDP